MTTAAITAPWTVSEAEANIKRVLTQRPRQYPHHEVTQLDNLMQRLADMSFTDFCQARENLGLVPHSLVALDQLSQYLAFRRRLVVERPALAGVRNPKLRRKS